MGKYLLSFTACPTRRAESVILARTYLDCGDWDEVRRRCIENDILMLRFESSRIRISRELIKRLKMASAHELAALSDSKDVELQSALCWISICRTYELVSDFIQQVVAVRWEQGKSNLPIGAYETFYEDATLVHPELARLAEATRSRLRNQLFQMIREAGFIDQNNNLIPYVLPTSVAEYLGPDEAPFFPTLVRSSSPS